MENWVPSGKRLQFAIENGPIEIVDLSIRNGDVPYSYVSLPEGSWDRKPDWSWLIYSPVMQNSSQNIMASWAIEHNSMIFASRAIGHPSAPALSDYLIL